MPTRAAPENQLPGPGALVAAAWRVSLTAVALWRLERHHGLDELVGLLRTPGPRRAGAARRAVLEARVAGALLPLLPPWRMGRCIKRSLLQLALWSRLGIPARLCLGTQALEGGRREGHAWLQVEDPELAPLAGRPAAEAVVVL